MVMSATALPLAFIVLLVGSQTQAKNHALETNSVHDHFAYTHINFIFDIFLKHYTKKLINEGKTKLHVEDFKRDFATRLFSLDIEAGLEATDGWCSNLSTLHRTGDADMNRDGKGITLTAHLGLNDLHIDFNKYDISLMNAHQKGKIHVNVGENSIFIKLDVKIEPKCEVTVTELKIEKLEGIQVDISNLGVFEGLTDEIATLITKEVTQKYKAHIEGVVLPELSKAVKDADLCHYIPHLLL